ncbi:hypothetical protein [Desulfogranum japonicum]|uniref:hypothetical protein n=1 Tax=Desulfogranum japonicum TaxID=231447 RepID=UPI000490702C|nr:hypothetical protein [Desulfogranum japonicum]
MKNKKSLKIFLLIIYCLAFWILIGFLPELFKGAASWLYEITGSKVLIIITSVVVLIIPCVIYAFAGIQGEFFGPIKKEKKK